MSSALSIQFLMAAYVMGLILISFGAEGAPSKLIPKKERNNHHKPSETSDPSSYRLVLDPEFKPSSGLIRPINNDSISPWTYTFTYDENLYPPNIAEAQCLLSGCLVDGVEVQDYQSKPIFTQILVLRRIHGDHKHSYTFRLEYKTISVGCTCVQPYVEHV